MLKRHLGWLAGGRSPQRFGGVKVIMTYPSVSGATWSTRTMRTVPDGSWKTSVMLRAAGKSIRHKHAISLR